MLTRLNLDPPKAKGAPTPGLKENDTYETEEQRALEDEKLNKQEEKKP